MKCKWGAIDKACDSYTEGMHQLLTIHKMVRCMVTPEYETLKTRWETSAFCAVQCENIIRTNMVGIGNYRAYYNIHTHSIRWTQTTEPRALTILNGAFIPKFCQCVAHDQLLHGSPWIKRTAGASICFLCRH